MSDCRWHDVALARRNVTDTRYLTVRRDPIQLAVVWFNGVEITASRNQRARLQIFVRE